MRSTLHHHQTCEINILRYQFVVDAMISVCKICYSVIMFFHGPLNCFAEWQTGIILDRMTIVILRVMEMQIRWIYNCTLPFVLQKWQFSIILWQPSLNRRSVTWNSQPPAVDIVYSISPVTLQAGLAKTAAREVRVRLRAGWGLKVRLRHLGG